MVCVLTRGGAQPSERRLLPLAGATAAVAMEETRFELTHIMMPQEKNIHNKIFGGFLMRKGTPSSRLVSR
jgi:hypothetical protein